MTLGTPTEGVWRGEPWKTKAFPGQKGDSGFKCCPAHLATPILEPAIYTFWLF